MRILKEMGALNQGIIPLALSSGREGNVDPATKYIKIY